MFGKAKINEKAEVVYVLEKKPSDRWVLTQVEGGEVTGRSRPLKTLRDTCDLALSLD